MCMGFFGGSPIGSASFHQGKLCGASAVTGEEYLEDFRIAMLATP